MIKLKAARLAKRWSQQTLGFYARLSGQEICRIERGYQAPYPAQAARLAKVLGLHPAELLEEGRDAVKGDANAEAVQAEVVSAD